MRNIHERCKLVNTALCLQRMPCQLGNIFSEEGKRRNNVSETEIKAKEAKPVCVFSKKQFFASTTTFPRVR